MYGIFYPQRIPANTLLRYVGGRIDRVGGWVDACANTLLFYRPATFERFWGRLGLCCRVKVTLRVLNVY